jgi:hypothetical protein
VYRAKEDPSLEMKPLRIQPDDKWLESYTAQFCDGGKVPPPFGPYHPTVLLSSLKGYQQKFVKGWPQVEVPM